MFSMTEPRWTELCVPLLLRLALVGALAPPQNLTLHTLNTFYELRWDWADESAGNQTVTFTTAYLSNFQSARVAHKQKWKPVCVDVVERRCDFTHLQLHYMGGYSLCVRASTAKSSSSCSEIKFCPDDQAALGPPSAVKLHPAEGGLEIALTDPLTSTNESMRTVLGQMGFLIQYWRHDGGIQTAKLLVVENNLVVLQDLDRWTLYCVRVQSHRKFDNKTSVFSDTHCTETRGPSSVWRLFLYFLSSLVFCFVLVVLLAFGSYKVVTTLKGVFYPSSSLPLHIQDLWRSDVETPRLLALGSPESVCELVSVSSAVKAVPSSSAEEQDYSGGSDSGVYSTEEDSPHGPDDSTDSELSADLTLHLMECSH